MVSRRIAVSTETKAAAARAPFAASKVRRMMADTQPALQSRANRDQRLAWLAVGLAAAVRLPRDPRFQRRVIVLAIGLAALSGLARNGQATSLARLAAWDKKQQMRAMRVVKGKAGRA
jgi:hypothetical protein